MRIISLFIALSLFSNSAFSQDSSPYKTSFKTDGSLIIGGLGLSYLGLNMIKNKDDLTEAQVMALSKSDVNFFDRSAAGNYDDNLDKLSYYPFYASFAMPVVMLLNKNTGSKAGQVLVLYLETMAVTGTLYTLTAGNVKRSRPLVYSSDAPLSKRTDKDSQRSFYAGHTAATAAATFFAAKVFQDFNPDSGAKPYVWAAAAIVPAAVGYLRLKSGYHFLSDNLLGYVVGAGTGILIPQLHKSNSSNLTIHPVIGPQHTGINLSYTFKQK